MRIPQGAIPYIRTTILIIFVVASLVFYGFFWVASGGRLPIVNPTPYQVTFQSPINKNIVEQSEVTLNGISVGRVQKLEVLGGLAQITAGFDTRPDLAPLHEGVKATIKTKTLINETYIDLTDGNGPPLADQTVLPPGNVAPPVDTDEVVRALPQEARKNLSGAIQSLAVATDNNQSGISQTIGSLGEPTNYVPAALTALANQEPALRQLTSNTARLLQALDTREGQIGELVGNAELVTRTTAGSREDLSNVIRKLSPTLVTAQNASDDLSRLGFALQPVANNLNRAAKPLNEALRELPPTARDLRELLPYLNSTLDKLPPTLKRVPRFAGDVQDLSPVLYKALRELNPVVAYLEPCAQQLTQGLTNGGMSLTRSSSSGPVVAVAPLLGADSIAQLAPALGPLAPVLGAVTGPVGMDYQIGNNPVRNTYAPGTPNSNIQCKTPLNPYTR